MKIVPTSSRPYWRDWMAACILFALGFLIGDPHSPVRSVGLIMMAVGVVIFFLAVVYAVLAGIRGGAN